MSCFAGTGLHGILGIRLRMTTGKCGIALPFDRLRMNGRNITLTLPLSHQGRGKFNNEARDGALWGGDVVSIATYRMGPVRGEAA